MATKNDTPDRAARTRGNGEGSVYFDTNKQCWFAKVTVDGKRRKKAAASEAAAKRLLRDLLRDTDEGTPSHGNITIASLLAEWGTSALPARNLRPRTIELNLWAVNTLTDMLGSKRLRNLEASDVERAFKATDYSRESLIKLRSVLGKALDYALRRKLVTTNIARHVELPTDARRTEPGRALTVEQAKVLLEHARAPDGSTRCGSPWSPLASAPAKPPDCCGMTSTSTTASSTSAGR